ncbi:MAG: hypothetical protein ACI4SF_16145 [Oscillospiraceae bacterium]
MSAKTKKAFPYIAVNLIGAIIVLLCFFVRSVADIGFFGIFLTTIVFEISPLGVIVIVALILALNAAAFSSIDSNKSESGVLCSAFFGSLGGVIAIHTVNKGYEKAKAVKLIFNVHLWLCIYLLISWLLYRYDYYHFSVFR